MNSIYIWNSQPDLSKISPIAMSLLSKHSAPLVREPWHFENQSSPTASTVTFTEIGLQSALSKFASYLIENTKDVEPEYVRIVEENFWDLLA